MAKGPGKYGEALEKLMKDIGATEAFLVVLDGPKGPGFSATFAEAHRLSVPIMLRAIASNIERDTGWLDDEEEEEPNILKEMLDKMIRTKLDKDEVLN